MIVQRTTPRMLSGGGLLALLGAGAFLLPVMPSWAQTPPPETIRARFVDDADVAKARVKEANIELLTAELAKKRAELAQLEAQLKAAQAGKRPEGAAEKPEVKLWRILDGKAVEVKPGENATLEVERKRLESLLREREQNKERPLVIEVTVDGKKKVIELPPGSRVINPYEAAPPPVPPLPAPGVKPREGASAPPATAREPQLIYRVAPNPASGDTAKRVAEVEKRLADIVRELETLRMELKANPVAPPLRVVPTTIDRNETPRK
jgi:hypothetical protein